MFHQGLRHYPECPVTHAVTGRRGATYAREMSAMEDTARIRGHLDRPGN